MLKNSPASATRSVAACMTPKPEFFHPYVEPQVNLVYNLLFCDNHALFRRDNAAKDAPWSNLLADPPSASALRHLADDAAQESRVRALAYHRLRMSGNEVPQKILLGVIVEVPLAQGLDVLAAYADGTVRYINQTGKIAIFEGGPAAVVTLARNVIASAQRLVEQTGPWEHSRLPSPQGDKMRLTFIVSDGLYFGEGRFAALRSDALGGPVVNAALALLQVVVEPATH